MQLKSFHWRFHYTACASHSTALRPLPCYAQIELNFRILHSHSIAEYSMFPFPKYFKTIYSYLLLFYTLTHIFLRMEI